MDLGFGSSNQQVGSLTARAIVQSAQAQESQLQNEIDKYDSLLDDSTALEQLRARRLKELQHEQKKRQQWQAAGHGVYQELVSSQDARDVAREFFGATKQSDMLVVHFYRNSTPLCDVFHKHLTLLAPKHQETRFCKIDVEDCDQTAKGASFLVQRLGIVVMPTLILVKNRKVVHHLRGFDELGGSEDFELDTLEYVLGVHGVIEHDLDKVPKELMDGTEGINAIRIRGHRGRGYEDQEDF